MTVSGIISDQGGVTQTGSGGTVTFTNTSNSYFGPTTLGSGTFSFSGSIFGNSSTINLAGGTLDPTVSMSFGSAINLTADGSTLETSTGDTFNITGNINGTHTLFLAGAGTIELSGGVGNTAKITTITDNATKTIINTSTVATNGGTQTYNTPVVLASDTTFSDTGNITFNSTVDGNFNMIATTTGANDTGTVAFNGAVGGTTPLASLSVTGTNVTLNAGTIQTNGTQSYTSTNPVVVTGTNTLTGTGITLPSVSLGTATLNMDPSSTSTISAISGSGTLTMGGTGTLTLSGNNSSFTGTTTINNGTLALGNNNALGSPSSTVLATVNTNGTLDVSNFTLPIPTGDTISLNGGTLASSGTGVVASSGTGAINLAAASSVGGTGSLTISSLIEGSNGLTKNGSGTVSLTNTANTYTGQTTINNGILSVSELNASGSTSSIGQTTFAILIGSNATAGTLSDTNISGTDSTNLGITVNGIAGGTVQATTGTLTLSGAINDSGDPLTFANTGNILVSGIISGSGGSVTKTGTGTLTLSSNSNSYSGNTYIDAGTLISRTNALGTSAVTVSNTGSASTLEFLSSSALNATNAYI